MTQKWEADSYMEAPTMFEWHRLCKNQNFLAVTTQVDLYMYTNKHWCTPESIIVADGNLQP